MLLFSSDAITLDLGAELLELKVQRWRSPLQSCLKDLEAKVEKTRQSQEEVRETLRKAEQFEAKLQQFMVDTCQTQAKLSADLSQVLKQQSHLQNKQDQLVRKQDLLHTTVTGDYFPPIPEAIMTSPVSSVPPSLFSPTGRFFNPPRTRLPLFRSPSCPPSLVLNTPTATTPTDDDISEYLSYLSEELADVLEHPSCPTVKPSGGIPDIDELLQSVSTLTPTHQDGGPGLSVGTQDGGPIPSIGTATLSMATHQDGGPGPSIGTATLSMVTHQDGGPGPSIGTATLSMAAHQDGGPGPSIGTATLSTATHQDGRPIPSIGTATISMATHQDGGPGPSGTATLSTATHQDGGPGPYRMVDHASSTQLRPASQVMDENRHLWNEEGVGKLTIRLARYSYFGDNVLRRSTRTGKGGSALDELKVAYALF